MERDQMRYGDFDWGGGMSAHFDTPQKNMEPYSVSGNSELRPTSGFFSIQNEKKDLHNHVLKGWQDKGLDVLGKYSDNDCNNIDGKEIYMLSARMGSTMATLSRLNENAFLAVKIHKAILPQSQAFACLLSSSFEDFTAIPFTEVYTDNIYFVGRNFKKNRFQKYKLISKLHSCTCLKEDAFQDACEKLANEYNGADRRQLHRFKTHLALCGDKVYAERFKHDILMCQVYIEGTLDGRIRKRMPWISQKAANLLNRKVFKRISPSVRDQNIQTLMCILKSPVGAQLRPLFSPTCDPEIPLSGVTVQDQMRCLVTHTKGLSSQMGSTTLALINSEGEKTLTLIIEVAESLDRRLRALEDSLG